MNDNADDAGLDELDCHGQARRALLRLSLYVPPAIIGTMLISPNAVAAPAASCGPAACPPNVPAQPLHPGPVHAIAMCTERVHPIDLRPNPRLQPQHLQSQRWLVDRPMDLTTTPRLYLDSTTLVRAIDADTIELADLAGSWSCQATGALRKAVQGALAGSPLSPALLALGSEHPLVRTVSRLRQESGCALTAAQAVALDGFGTLFVELTGACNEYCIHCYAEARPGLGQQLERPLCEALLDDAGVLGFERVQFTGGDPLLCAFLPQLLERAAVANIPACEIFTNGLLLGDRLLARLRPYRPAFALSFYSVDAARHEAITRTPGSHRRTTQAFQRLLDSGLPVRASVIVMPQNADTVAETIAYLQDLGLTQIGVTSSRAVGRGHGHEEPPNATWEPARHDGAPAQHGDASANARARSGKLCVTYDGLVVPCIFNRRDVLGDLRLRRLLDIAKSPQPVPGANGGDALITACRDQLQCLSCRLTAYALRSGATSP